MKQLITCLVSAYPKQCLELICGIQLIYAQGCFFPEVLLSSLGSLFKVTALENQLLNPIAKCSHRWFVLESVTHPPLSSGMFLSLRVHVQRVTVSLGFWELEETLRSLDYKCKKCYIHFSCTEESGVQQTQGRQHCVYPEHFQSLREGTNLWAA